NRVVARTLGKHRPDVLAGDHDVVDEQMEIGRRRCSAAVVDVHPDLLDLDRWYVAHADIGLIEDRITVDPGAHDAVFAANLVELEVLLDAIPAIALQQRP